MNSIEMPYIQREEEKEKDLLTFGDNKSKAIVIRGASGTGKTTLVKNKLASIIDSQNKINYLIVMLDIIDDNITPSIFLDLLCFLLWNGNIHDSSLTININKKDSLSRYIKSKRRNKKFSKILFYSIQSTISMVPKYGAVLSSNMEKVSKIDTAEYDFDKNEILRKFFKKITKNNRVIIVVDNYQFMLPQIRLSFEAMLNSLKKNLTFISIYRIENMVYSQYPICFSDNRKVIELNDFDLEHTKQIFYKLYRESTFINKVAEDCFFKTKGNLKEIELYIRKNHNAILNNSLRVDSTDTLKNDLSRLPEIQRFIVLLSTLFPSGIKLEYLFKFINKMYIVDKASLDIELRKLITLGYIIINSKNNNLLKPSHDRIGIKFDRNINDEEFIELYRSVETTLEELIAQKTYKQDYIYLLHCLIGVSSFTDLQKNISYLVELISLEYNNCSFFYIVDLISSIKEIINYLPESTIFQVLDSCQKSSEFSLGLEFYNQIKQNPHFINDYSIFAIKYLTQTYDFEQALSLVDNIEITNESTLYKLNILQHQGNDEDAIAIIEKLLINPKKDKWFYLILRNSAHYFNYEDAKDNLNECLKYFEKNGSLFDVATVYNNLSVIEIWNGAKTFSAAKSNIKKSINIHLRISSNEIFEPYWNYSVLLFCENNYADSLYYINLSLDELPHRLELDIIAITLNKWICEYALGIIKLSELYENIKSAFNKPIINKDPWIKFQVKYNLYNVEKKFIGFSEINYDNYYIEKQKKFTGFEVFYKVKGIDISLSLSPNWRY